MLPSRALCASLLSSHSHPPPITDFPLPLLLASPAPIDRASRRVCSRHALHLQLVSVLNGLVHAINCIALSFAHYSSDRAFIPISALERHCTKLRVCSVHAGSASTSASSLPPPSSASSAFTLNSATIFQASSILGSVALPVRSNHVPTDCSALFSVLSPSQCACGDGISVLAPAGPTTPVASASTTQRLFATASVATAAQLQYLTHLRSLSLRFIRRRAWCAGIAPEPTPQASSQPSLSPHPSTPDFLPHSTDATNPYAKSDAVNLVAALVSLPERPGAVPLLNLLPPEISSVYASAHSLHSASGDLQPTASAPRRVAQVDDRSEYVALIRRMMGLGMVSLVREPVVVNGLFAVPKGGKQRLIIDARPANALFPPPPHTDLPTPDLIASLVVPSDVPLFAAKCDLSDFYHTLRLPDWLVPFFALPSVTYRELGVDSLTPDALVHPACTTLPMGWSHSVFLAQSAHEFVMRRGGVYDRCEPLTRANVGSVTGQRVRVQTYIDDTVFYGLDSAAVRAAQDDYIRCVSDAGLLIRASKCIAPTCDGIECVGLEVHGRHHTVGLSATKLNSLIRDTSALLRSSATVTGHSVSRLVGRWSWAFLACRPAFAAFSAVYRFVECAGYARFTLWPSAARELRTAIGLAPALFSSLCMPVCPTALATDASSEGLGVCSTVAHPQALAALVAATSEPWLFTPASQPGMQPTGVVIDHSTPLLQWHAGGPARVRPAFEDCMQDFVRSSAWLTRVSARWRRPEHINALEMRAVHTSLRWLRFHTSAIGRRVLLLTDSSAVLGALLKGRCSSRPLLTRLRAVTGVLLASGMRLAPRWVPSALNPADDPSRGIGAAPAL